MEPKFLSVSEAARLLGMSGDWVRVQEKTGKLRAIKSAGGIRLFALEDVQKLAAKRQASVGEAASQWETQENKRARVDTPAKFGKGVRSRSRRILHSLSQFWIRNWKWIITTLLTALRRIT